MTAYEAFEHTYKKEPQHIAFTPCRVCPIGAHSDRIPEDLPAVTIRFHKQKK